MLLEARTTREDSLALHGRSGSLLPGPVHCDECVCGTIFFGTSRWCVNVVSPCDKVKTQGQKPEHWIARSWVPYRSSTPKTGGSPRTGLVTQPTQPHFLIQPHLTTSSKPAAIPHVMRHNPRCRIGFSLKPSGLNTSFPPDALGFFEICAFDCVFGMRKRSFVILAWDYDFERRSVAGSSHQDMIYELPRRGHRQISAERLPLPSRYPDVVAGSQTITKRMVHSPERSVLSPEFRFRSRELHLGILLSHVPALALHVGFSFQFLVAPDVSAKP